MIDGIWSKPEKMSMGFRLPTEAIPVARIRSGFQVDEEDEEVHPLTGASLKIREKSFCRGHFPSVIPFSLEALLIYIAFFGPLQEGRMFGWVGVG